MSEYTQYHVTGVDKAGKRFKFVYTNLMQADSINLYRGSVWELKSGKRKLLKRVTN
jgi:hypothetical protein